MRSFFVFPCVLCLILLGCSRATENAGHSVADKTAPPASNGTQNSPEPEPVPDAPVEPLIEKRPEFPLRVTPITFQETRARHREPFITGYWQHDGTVYVGVDFVHDCQLMRYEAGETKPVQFVEGPLKDAQPLRLLDLGDEAILITSGSGSGKTYFRVRGLEATALKVPNELTRLALEHAVVLGGVAFFESSDRMSDTYGRLYVYTGDGIEPVTMPDGSYAEGLPKLDAGSGRILLQVHGDDKLTEYALEGTVLIELPAPLSTGGKTSRSYRRVHTKDGAFVTQGDECWFERATVRQDIVDDTGQPIKFEYATIVGSNGVHYLFGSKPTPGLWLIHDAPLAMAVPLPPGWSSEMPYVTISNGKFTLWRATGSEARRAWWIDGVKLTPLPLPEVGSELVLGESALVGTEWLVSINRNGDRQLAFVSEKGYRPVTFEREYRANATTLVHASTGGHTMLLLDNPRGGDRTYPALLLPDGTAVLMPIPGAPKDFGGVDRGALFCCGDDFLVGIKYGPTQLFRVHK